MRFLTRTAAIVVSLTIVHGVANAQKKCTKGIPCGNSCIAASKTCRVGTRSAAPKTDTSSLRLGSVGTATTGDWIASRRGKTYYKAGCSGANRLSAANVIHFKSEAEAQKSGYHRSSAKGC